MPLAKQRQELVAGRDIAVRAPRRVDVELVLCEIRQDASRPHVVVLRDSSPAGGRGSHEPLPHQRGAHAGQVGIETARVARFTPLSLVVA